MNISDFILSNRFGYYELYDENMAYDGSGRLEYTGFAPQGASDADSKWQIFKFTYDGNGALASCKTSPRNAVWDNRATYF